MSSCEACDAVRFQVLCEGLAQHGHSQTLQRKAARVSHEKALWAQHWIDQMWAAETPEQFWINLTLATKIIDARLDYDSDFFRSANKWGKFAGMFTRGRKERINKWKRQREKKLYGSDKPKSVFLTA